MRSVSFALGGAAVLITTAIAAHATDVDTYSRRTTGLHVAQSSEVVRYSVRIHW